FFTSQQKEDLLNNGQLSINKNSLDKNKILKDITEQYAEMMAVNVFSSQSKQNNTGVELSEIDFIKDKKIKRQTGKDTWLHLSIDADNIEIKIDGASSPDLQSINHLILREIFDIPNVFISVSERLGISLFQKDLDENMANIMDRLKKNKDIDPFNMLFEQSSRYALPIKDNIDFMRAIEKHQKTKSELEVDLSTHIENMFGSDGYGGKLRHNGTEIRFSNSRKGDNKMDIPLHLASASVRALSNLYFFLKHKAKIGDLIIIDEPESHLSLAKQRLLAKLIADCINNGLKILLTTHSDTLVLELNNLIMLNSDFENKDAFMKKHTYTTNHVIKPASVSAYIAENGGVSECNIDKYGIEVNSMDNDIEKLNTVRDGLEARI
ncbi:MAG: AAA family ATPase, partial [Candidatus Thioglobus sp.]|uniref:AAA family ATPase n=1 Tax=Candidatus Thioglobus sp. TaxID=2026721 RepID=UPI00261E5F4A